MANKKREARPTEEDENVIATRKERFKRSAFSKSNELSEKQEDFVSVWQIKINWNDILSGTILAIAVQLVLSSASAFTGYGIAGASSISDLRDIVNGFGIWAVLSVMIASFIGAYAASRFSRARISGEGLLAGTFVWAIILIANVFFSALGTGGLLGFTGNAVSALRGVIPSGGAVSMDDVGTAATVAVALSRYFFIGLLLSLATALLGGWLGSDRQKFSETMLEDNTSRRNITKKPA
jgi:hypothetical protein